MTGSMIIVGLILGVLAFVVDGVVRFVAAITGFAFVVVVEMVST